MEEINVKELLYTFWKSKKFIFVMLIVSIAVGVLYQSFLVKPKYKSTTSLVLSKGNNTKKTIDDTQGITQNDVTLNQKLVSTYGEIIKLKKKKKDVISKLSLNMTEDEFISNISVESKKDTELLEIIVSNEDSKKSMDIANALAKAFANKVAQVYNINNVSVIDVAEQATQPYNISLPKTLVIFAFAGLFISFLIIFIKFYFNNTVSNEDDIEKTLGLPILAVVPKYEDK